MIRITSILLICLSFLSPSSALALQDQGLSSVMDIIDKAVQAFTATSAEEQVSEDEAAKTSEAASATVVNLSRTLGKLSYSRLQCGQADVLAEFTQRVQKMPQAFRDPMRDAFQEGFDKSKAETPLLSEDECERLTQSRIRGENQIEANVEDEKKDKPKKAGEKKPKVVEEVEDPALKHMRIAELSGQLAYRRKFCGDNKVITRDFNEVISKMPEQFQSDAKKAYWKGYKHGKQLNKDFNRDQCL